MSLLIKKKSPYMSLNPIQVHKLLIKIKGGKKKKPAYADGIREGTRTLQKQRMKIWITIEL